MTCAGCLAAAAEEIKRRFINNLGSGASFQHFYDLIQLSHPAFVFPEVPDQTAERSGVPHREAFCKPAVAPRSPFPQQDGNQGLAPIALPQLRQTALSLGNPRAASASPAISPAAASSWDLVTGSSPTTRAFSPAQQQPGASPRTWVPQAGCSSSPLASLFKLQPHSLHLNGFPNSGNVEMHNASRRTR